MAVRLLFAAAATILLANFVIYFGYAALMPTYPDFEAGRVIKVRLGGQQWVYVSENEAFAHQVVQKWLGAVGLLSMVGASMLHQRSIAHENR